MSAPAPAQAGGTADGALHLALGNTLASVEDGRVKIIDHLAPLDLDPRVINRLEVIFEELIGNIVRHGFAPGSDQQILVGVRALDDAIELTVEDDGRPFNPLLAATPAPYGSLESARIGGLGIPLIRKLAAALRYEIPVGGGGAFAPNNRMIVSVAR